MRKYIVEIAALEQTKMANQLRRQRDKRKKELPTSKLSMKMVTGVVKNAKKY